MKLLHHALYKSFALATLFSMFALSGCSSSSSSAMAPDAISIYLTSPFVTVPSTGSQVTSVVTINRSLGNVNPVTLTVSGVPTGASITITQPGTGSFGTLFVTSSPSVTPGTYPVTVSATDGSATSTAAFSVILSPPDAVTLTLGSTSLLVRQDANTTATGVSLPFTVGRSVGNTNSVTVAATGLPTNLTPTYTQPAGGTTGSVLFTTSAATPTAAGVYTVTITATDTAGATASSTVTITIAVALIVANATDTTIGVSQGHLQQFMSTGFQPSTYNNAYFVNNPSTTDLAALSSRHLRLQPVVGAIPWSANSTPQAASDWSFTALDQTVQPVLGVDDNSPIFQIAKAPSFMDDANGHFIFNSTNLSLLTTYAQNLVRYYNTGGFTWGGKTFASSGTHHITWWAIFNEPNLNNITAAQYVQMYNTLVPAMLAVDPTLKFVGLELSDYSGQPQAFMPTLVQAAASGGINAPLNALATHFYGTCVQSTTDASLFSGVTQFATDVKYIAAELATRSDLAGTPIWVTENNVNSDYALTTGYSSCTPTQLYVLDTRGTSPFFTAYRPLIFSVLGKAGNESLYHFLYEGSAAYGEVNSGSNAKTLAYWTDYWLARTFPWDGVSTGALLYKTTTSEKTATVDVMAVRNADNSVAIMVTNYAVASSTDDNGTGGARTVVLDTTALGTFTSGTEVDLNGATPLATGPTAKTITPANTLTLNFTGYGASMFVLKP